MNKCIIIRSLPLDRDSRTKRYKYLLKDKYDVMFNTWEDFYDHKRKGLEKLKLPRKKSPLFFSYPMYLFYLFIYSLLKINKDTTVICMDLDTYLPVKLAQKFKRFKIVFDIVDPISQTRYRNIPGNVFFDRIELRILSSDETVILPSEYRVNYYIDKFKVDKSDLSFIICENVFVPGRKESKLYESLLSKEKIRIGYFGSLDRTRGIQELIEFSKKHDYIQIVIAGRGELVTEIEGINSDEVIFLGTYSSEDLEELYDLVDFVWAYYEPSILLHHYAAPNKFYEHLAFKTPIIFNQCVPQVDYVIEHRSGIVINDELSDDNFKNLLVGIKTFVFENADYSDWDDEFKEYKFEIN